MTASRSDALVLFGVTGDLAHKLIFPALYAMVKSNLMAATMRALHNILLVVGWCSRLLPREWKSHCIALPAVLMEHIPYRV
jgi:hypothetical protein